MKRLLDGGGGALDQILESLPEIVTVVGREGNIRYLNRVEPGYDRASMIGVSAEALVSDESRPMFQATLARVLATGETVEYQVPVDHPDGSRAWYQSRMVPYREQEQIVGVVILATNVTDLKRAMDEAERLRSLLPICAWCDRIQQEDGSWGTIEEYLAARTGTVVTHGMCPECHQRQLKAI